MKYFITRHQQMRKKLQPGKANLNNSLNDAPVSRAALKKNSLIYFSLSGITKIQAFFVSYR